ncbi:MAG: hypothetical protein LBL91_05480 [Lachnospiraceae bacterium]|jgi:hypothetical protein|nr:hypothetical protein [Lachnospiraceae bacterium]
MDSFAHILTILKTGAKRGTSLEGIKNIVEKYSSYMTLPDSMRSELNPTEDGSLRAYRPLTHFTGDTTGNDYSWIKFPYGDKLKNFKDIKELQFYIPSNAEMKGSDGPTNINVFVEHNQELLSTAEGAFVYAHLAEDMLTDVLFQQNLATPDYESDKKEAMELYGFKINGGTCTFNKTGKTATMAEFRNAITLTNVVIFKRLWSEIKEAYPNLTINEIVESAKKAYDKDFNPTMAEHAYKYMKPNQNIQALVENEQGLSEPIDIAGVQVSNVNGIEDKLVEMQVVNSREEIEGIIDELIETVDITAYIHKVEELNYKRKKEAPEDNER